MNAGTPHPERSYSANDPRVVQQTERGVRDLLLSLHTPELTALVDILRDVSDRNSMNSKLYYAAKNALESRS